MPERTEPSSTGPLHWLTVTEAAGRARCGVKIIYGAVRAGRLQASRIGGRGDLRFRAEWVDEFLTASSTPVMVEPKRPRGDATL